MTITLRPMLPADLPALADLYATSIATLCEEDYGEDQLSAWVERAEEPSFAKTLTENLTLLALHDGELAGFATLKGKDHIEMLYVHPEHARVGVATALIDALERLALARGAQALTVDASETALPLFQARNYSPQRRNSIPIGDVWLANTTLIKKLVPPAPKSTLQ
jgi:putative acetyltransferase